MENNVILEVTIVQIISIVLLLFACFYLIKQHRLNRYEKRIEAFSLFSNKDKDKSFFDKIFIGIENLVKLIERSLNKSNLTPGYAKKYEKYIVFEERNEKSGYYFISIKVLLSLAIGLLSLITMMFQYTNFNTSLFVLVLAIGFFVPDIYLNIEFKKKRKQIEEDLLKAIIIMNNAFKSGSNITQAVGIVKDELDGPISDEFKKIYIDINYGLSLDIVFQRFYERVKIEEAKYITSSLALLNKTGGNIVNVFTLIEKTFFDKKKLKNELNSLTASSVFIFRLLLAMPFFLFVIIFMVNPTYFAPFFKSTIGVLVLLVLIILYVMYIVIVNKLLKVKI